jgi:hypothetical protein
VAVEVTLGTGMSCISSISRGEDNGGGNEDNLDDGQQGRTPPGLSVPRGNGAIQMEQRRSAVQIDQNQCRRLKGYYGFDQPKSVAGAGGFTSRPSVITLCRAMSGGKVMTTPVPEYSTHIYEMMTRLGIEPGAGVLPHLSLRYATAVRRCENCRSKTACQNWLDYAPAMLNFAPFLYER